MCVRDYLCVGVCRSFAFIVEHSKSIEFKRIKLHTMCTKQAGRRNLIVAAAAVVAFVVAVAIAVAAAAAAVVCPFDCERVQKYATTCR